MNQIDNVECRLATGGTTSRVRLPEALLATFETTDAEQRRRLAFWGMWLGLVFYMGLLLIDWLLIPDVYALNVATRVCIGMPFGIAALWLLTKPSVPSLIHQLGACAFGLACVGTMSFTLSHATNPASAFYFSANFVVLCFTINMAGLTTIVAAAMCITSIALSTYLLANSVFGSTTAILIYTFVGLLVTIICVFANWCIDNEKRRQFLAMQRDKLLLLQISEQRDLLKELSAIDPLTGLANRRGFEAMMASNLDNTRDGTSLAIGVIDIDFFKHFNDTYGHQHGDEALKAVAATLADASQGQARVARVGGEEFALLMANPDPTNLTAIGEKLCEAVEKRGISHAGSQIASVVTVSVGLAGGSIRTKDEFAKLFDTADKALYAAKRTGRNRACVAAAA